MSDNTNNQNWQEFQELSNQRILSEQPDNTVTTSTIETHQLTPSEQNTAVFDTQGMALIFGIGAFIISLICLYTVLKNSKNNQQDKPNKLRIKRKSSAPFGIRPEFLEEAKSERQHRIAQRKKYGIFDKDGKRLK